LPSRIEKKPPIKAAFPAILLITQFINFMSTVCHKRGFYARGGAGEGKEKSSHKDTKAQRGRIYHGVTRRKREKKGRRVRLQFE
jgi:hypothetical protein